MRFIINVIVGVVLSLVIGFGLFYLLNSSSKTTIEKGIDSEVDIRSLIKYQRHLEIALDSLHQPLDRPSPGEWLSMVNESGQTLVQYVSNKPNGRTKIRHKVYIRPIGSFSDAEKEVLQLTSEYLEKFYDTPVEILDSISNKLIPIASKRVHQNKHQASAKYILDSILSPNIPSDAVAYIAFAKIDLYNNPKKNFVFGLGSKKNRVGVYSIARFGDLENKHLDNQKFLLRTLKVASHELGHIFSVTHCIEYECIMNGSNGMAESDLKPVYLCPKDLMKVCWNIDINEVERYKQLETFWIQNGFKENAEFYRKSIIQLDSIEMK